MTWGFLSLTLLHNVNIITVTDLNHATLSLIHVTVKPFLLPLYWWNGKSDMRHLDVSGFHLIQGLFVTEHNKFTHHSVPPLTPNWKKIVWNFDFHKASLKISSGAKNKTLFPQSWPTLSQESSYPKDFIAIFLWNLW